MTSAQSSAASAAGLHFKPEITCAISVRDFKAAARWYQEVLGFQMLYAVEEMPWGEFQTALPGCTIGIGGLPPGADAPAQGGAVITFGTNDIDADRAALEAKGVQFEGPTEEVAGMVKLATFMDPDGNRFMLAQTLQPTQ